MKLRRAVTSRTPAPSQGAGNVLHAIDEMYVQHLGKVKRWARRLARPSADLEDLLHDIFLIPPPKGFQDRGEATIQNRLVGLTQRVVAAERGETPGRPGRV